MCAAAAAAAAEKARSVAADSATDASSGVPAVGSASCTEAAGTPHVVDRAATSAAFTVADGTYSGVPRPTAAWGNESTEVTFSEETAALAPASPLLARRARMEAEAWAALKLASGTTGRVNEAVGRGSGGGDGGGDGGCSGDGGGDCTTGLQPHQGPEQEADVLISR